MEIWMLIGLMFRGRYGIRRFNLSVWVTRIVRVRVSQLPAHIPEYGHRIGTKHMFVILKTGLRGVTNLFCEADRNSQVTF